MSGTVAVLSLETHLRPDDVWEMRMDDFICICNELKARADRMREAQRKR